jgi:two-component system, OmpR family, alkaline phosphatase synthesis response regulator PhoP
MNENKKRILIVDDEPGMVDAIRLRLEANNYDVLVARDGAEGLIKARAEKPDLIMLDIMLPNMDGFMVCRMLKFDEQYSHIPVVMLTARTQDTDVLKGKEVGADAYVKKPFKSEELLKTIKNLIDLNPKSGHEK